LKKENEGLVVSLRDVNEKSFTLESKIQVFKDIYEDLTKKLANQEIDKEKQRSAVNNMEEETNRFVYVL